jgi:Xaa-Pro aminopeptidase
VALIGAGGRIAVPGRADPTYPFRAHSEYFYLTDRGRPDGVLAFDPDEGWMDFVAPITRDELLWEGGSGGEPEGVPVTELPGWIEKHGRRRIACLGVPYDVAGRDLGLESELRAVLNRVRRQKDPLELGRMRAAEEATRAGFLAIVPRIGPGQTERGLQIELEAAFFRAGADFLAFDTVIGSGPNSAVLHTRPSARPLADGELVLIDAGGEVRGYASDITRTYPVSGKFSPDQTALHGIVREAGLAAIRACTAGTEWREVHRSAASVIAAGLVEFGLLRGEPDSLVDRGAASLFFPRGVGHMVGLGIRDAGEVLPGRTKEDWFPRLRVDLPLLPGHVFTVEPGIYFVPALLCDPDTRQRNRDAVDWGRVDGMLSFGGIRIEENVIVTDDGPEVLTADVPLPA